MDGFELIVQVFVIAGAIGGGAWAVSRAIGDVRTEVAEIKGKVDLLITALNLRVDSVEESPARKTK